jgi:hypothetical protein
LKLYLNAKIFKEFSARADLGKGPDKSESRFDEMASYGLISLSICQLFAAFFWAWRAMD